MVAPLSPAVTPWGGKEPVLVLPDAQPCGGTSGSVGGQCPPGLCPAPASASMAVGGLVPPWWHFKGGERMPWHSRSPPKQATVQDVPVSPQNPQPAGTSRPELGLSWGQGEAGGLLWPPPRPGGADIPVGPAAQLAPTGDRGWAAEVRGLLVAWGLAMPGWGDWLRGGGCPPTSAGQGENPENLERTKKKKQRRGS